MSFLRVTCDAAKGLQCRKRPAKDGPGENRLTTWSFKPPRTHVINFSALFPGVKQKHVAWNTVVTSYLKIRNNDDRDFKLKMTFVRTLEIFWEFGMCGKKVQIPWDELNHQTEKRCDWNGLEDEAQKSDCDTMMPSPTALSICVIQLRYPHSAMKLLSQSVCPSPHQPQTRRELLIRTRLRRRRKRRRNQRSKRGR